MGALAHAMWFVIIGFHIITNQISGAIAFINIVISGIFAILYYIKGKD